VILTGTGGDELFAGYVRYQLAMGECFQDSYRMLFEKMGPVKGVAVRLEMTHTKGSTNLYAFYDEEAENTFREAFDSCGGEGASDLQRMLTFNPKHFLGFC
jgi:hypothetical protein